MDTDSKSKCTKEEFNFESLKNKLHYIWIIILERKGREGEGKGREEI